MCVYRLEAVAPADRRHLEVQRRVFRVPAVVDEHLGSFVPLANLQELRIGRVRLAEVGAERPRVMYGPFASWRARRQIAP